LAEAFKVQSPNNSQVPICEFAKYCGQYRIRPDQAVKDFPEWLRAGDDMFIYDIASTAGINDIMVNEPCLIDPALLELDPEDIVVPAATKEIAPD
jgi:chaperone BCS1